MVIDCQNVSMINNHIHIWLLTVEMFQQSIIVCILDGHSLSKPLKFTIKM